MKKTIISILLCVCLIPISAQQNINVSIVKKTINSYIYIETTITNNNNEKVSILTRGISDPYGYVSGGGNSFITLYAYNVNNIVIGVSNSLIIPRNVNNEIAITLLKGESYVKLDRLYCQNKFLGFFNSRFGSELNQLEAKVKLQYIYFLKPESVILNSEFVSNKIIF